MEPQGRTIDALFHRGKQSKTLCLEKTTLRVRDYVQTLGLNAETKKDRHRAVGEIFVLTFPFIGPFPVIRLERSRSAADASRETNADQHWIRGIDHEQGVGDYKPTVRAAVGHILLGLFSFRNTEQPSAAQARRSHVDSEDTSHLGNSGDADGLGDNSNPSLYFALPSFGVFSGGVTNACSGVGLNAEACSRIFACYLLFRSGRLYQPTSWRCPKLDVVQREIGSDRLFQRLVPLFRGENGRPSRRISEGHDSQLQLENDRSPDLPQLRTSTKCSRCLRR